MESKNRKLLSDDDDSEKFCYKHCSISFNEACPPDCLSKCGKECLEIPVSIPPPPPYFPTKSSHKPSTLITCAIALISFTFLLVFCYAVYVRFYSGRIRRRRQSEPPPEETQREFLDEEHGPVLDHPIWYIRTIGLQQSVINAITVCKYKNGDGLIDGTECSVCLSEFEENETLRLLPKCSHAFHINCIDTWLRSHTNCPMCRAPILIENSGVLLPDSGVENSTQSEEIPMGNLLTEEENDDGVLELREEEEEDDEERERNDVFDEGLRDFQPMRRSVSLDSLSALKISSAVAILDQKVESGTELRGGNAMNLENVGKREGGSQRLMCLMNGSSSGKSQQSGGSSMKRSVSCSGKFLLRSSTQRSNASNRS